MAATSHLTMESIGSKFRNKPWRAAYTLKGRLTPAPLVQNTSGWSAIQASFSEFHSPIYYRCALNNRKTLLKPFISLCKPQTSHSQKPQESRLPLPLAFRATLAKSNN